MRGGCLGFSLLGLLVGVGLTVWLASTVMGGSSGTGGTTSVRAVPSSSAPAGTSLPIVVTPRKGLTGDRTVEVTSDSFPAGEAVVVATCGSGTALVSGPDACDDAAGVPGQVDADGHLEVRYPVRRVATIGGVPIDCAEQAGRCRVVVRSTSDPDRQGAADLEFASDLGSPEITLPD